MLHAGLYVSLNIGIIQAVAAKKLSHKRCKGQSAHEKKWECRQCFGGIYPQGCCAIWAKVRRRPDHWPALDRTEAHTSHCRKSSSSLLKKQFVVCCVSFHNSPEID